MSEAKPQYRAQSTAPKYAALSDDDRAAAAPKRSAEADMAALFPDAPMSTYFGEEARRLQLIKDQIWALFANGEAHLPSNIPRTAIAYTDVVELQLRLFACRKPQPRRALAPRDTPRSEKA